MELLVSAAIGELVSRSMSFVVGAYCRWKRPPSVEESLRLLHQLLLRIRAVVEDAEGRQVTNQGMLRQLKNLRDEMFRGCYLLDTARYHQLAIQDGKAGDDDQVVSHSFALSRFNPAKRLRFSASTSSHSRWMVFGRGKEEDLQETVRRLEGAIADMEEFIVFLTQYPPMRRRPYGAHLFLDKCMFGRHMEQERVIEFLLQPEAPPGRGGDGLAGVLPIIGPAQIGKSTLVEHVCADETVRDHFSMILFYRGVLTDETPSSLRDGCTVKHQKDHASRERLLLVIELSAHVHEETWRTLRSSSETRMARGSKIIITSRHEEIARLGTTQALRLRPLPRDAYWYFFKLRVFGSTDPEEHAKLASTAMEIAKEMRGSFLYANIFCGVLRTEFSAAFWGRVLAWMRKFMRTNGYLFGEYPDDVKMENRPACAWVLTEPSNEFLAYKPYPRYYSLQDEHPKITMQDVLSGKSNVRGDYEVLLWKSQIPPYYSTMTRCVMR